MPLRGMTLIIASMFFLVGPGILYNNLNNTGLAPAQTLTCPGWPDVTCQGSVSAGCQSSSSYCTLSGQTVSFFNQNSPFTQLLAGNIFGLFSAISNGGQTNNYGPFDLVQGGPYIQANCWVANNNAKSLTSYQPFMCTASNADGSNMTSTQAKQVNITSWNHNWDGNSAETSIPFFNIGSTTNTTKFGCLWEFQLNTTAGGNVNSFTWDGCFYHPTGGVNPPAVTNGPDYMMLIEIPSAYGGFNTVSATSCPGVYAGQKCLHMKLPVQFETWDTYDCNSIIAKGGFAAHPWQTSQQCLKWYDNLHAQVQAATSQTWGVLTPILTFFLGLVLLFIGLGIQVTAGGSVIGTGVQGGVGTNRQGTRLAQVLGLSLIVWTVLYSEFSTWFTSGLLPYGLDGNTGIVAFLLTGLFFFGAYDQVTSE